jgi:hypothetical protein
MIEQEAVEVTKAFVAKGDLAHLALFLWATGASLLLWISIRELAGSNRRFNDLVADLLRLSRNPPRS